MHAPTLPIGSKCELGTRCCRNRLGCLDKEFDPKLHAEPFLEWQKNLGHKNMRLPPALVHDPVLLLEVTKKITDSELRPVIQFRYGDELSSLIHLFRGYSDVQFEWIPKDEDSFVQSLFSPIRDVVLTCDFPLSVVFDLATFPSLEKVAQLTRTQIGPNIRISAFTSSLKANAADAFFQKIRWVDLNALSISLDYSLQIFDSPVSVLDVTPLSFHQEYSSPHWLNARPKVSIVIPVNNRARYLKQVLASLCKQTQSHETFEVLIVDDGSIDDSSTQAIEFLQSSGAGLVAKVLSWKKPLTPLRDELFRAGQSRNLGTAQSRGDILVYLDGDIQVPPGFVTEILRQHQENDVVQFTRRQSDPRSNSEYWSEFYRTDDWAELPRPWMYFSTYCVSVKRQLVLQVNGFKPSFLDYGFEDTLLGFQLHKISKKWKLSPLEVLHLQMESERRVVSKWEIKSRHMSISAQTFLRNQWSEEFYSYLFDLCGPHPRMRKFARFIGGKPRLQPIGNLIYRFLMRANQIRMPSSIRTLETSLRYYLIQNRYYD